MRARVLTEGKGERARGEVALPEGGGVRGEGEVCAPLPADSLKNAIDGAMRNRWVVMSAGGARPSRVHGCDSEFFFRSVVDAGQPWPPDVCAASREKYTHAHAGVL